MVTSSLLLPLEQHKVVVIIRGIAPAYMSDLFQALYDGGIRMAEITLNSEHALESISMMRKAYDGRMMVGAGTVLNEASAKDAIAAGAQFLVSPNVDEGMIRYAVANGVLPLPGAMTATEVVQAVRFGSPVVKIFPCSSLGPNYIKELKGPLNDIPMLAVGGINEDNVAEYMKAGAIGVGIGGSMVNKEWIHSGRFDLIRDYATMLRANMGIMEALIDTHT